MLSSFFILCSNFVAFAVCSQTLKLDISHHSLGYYATTVKVGSPPQEINMLLDTGSSDTWLMRYDNPFCFNSPNTNMSYDGKSITSCVKCSNMNLYNPQVSQTMKNENIDRFYISYSDKTFEDGTWITDDITVDGILVHQLQMGLAQFATTPVSGLLGLGFVRRENIGGYVGAPEKFYPNFPQVLKTQGIINTVAYSLKLNQGANDGSLIFGGVDPSHYEGDIYTFPMVNVYPDVVRDPATLTITLQSLGLENKAECQQQIIMSNSMPALLDVGTTYMSAPKEVVDNIAKLINAYYSPADGIYLLKCPPTESGPDLVFNFGELQINVPLSQLILQPEDGSSGPCGLAMMPTSTGFTLGGAILAKFYMVFDLDHYQVSLAKKSDVTVENSKTESIPADGSIPNGYISKVKPWEKGKISKFEGNAFMSDLSCSLSINSDPDTASTRIPKSTSSDYETTSAVYDTISVALHTSLIAIPDSRNLILNANSIGSNDISTIHGSQNIDTVTNIASTTTSSRFSTKATLPSISTSSPVTDVSMEIVIPSISEDLARTTIISDIQTQNSRPYILVTETVIQHYTTTFTVCNN